MNYEIVEVKSDDMEAVRKWLEKQYEENLDELNAQQLVNELTHLIVKFGGNIR